ncbi:MAG: cadherin-like beta sandwich domain-containing protein [Lachnospiraceae bacterium]|nr:cadherin-like beta sandwich domain-containing protein [Lachnospiraceae bacterium]
MMKEKWIQKGKKILGCLIALSLLVGWLMIPNTKAYADNLIIAFSSSSVKIGDTLKVQITLPAGVSATVNLTYPTELFTYSSASDTANVNAGTVCMTLGSYGSDNSRTTGTVTFKAKAAGTGGFSVSAPTAGNQEGDQVQVGGASANVTVKNESATTEKKKSADNTLAELTVSEGKLSPDFQKDIKNYTVEVEEDVTSIVVSAKPNDSKASVESISGGEDLKVGENQVKVVVKAENGVTDSYCITVTRKGAAADSEAEEGADGAGDAEKCYEINGVKLYPTDQLPAEVLPEGMAQAEIELWGETYPCISREDSDSAACFIWLVDENGANGAWYMIDREDPYSIYPFACVDFDSYMQQQETVETLPEEIGQTQELEDLERQNRMILYAFIVVVIILLIVIIILAGKRKNGDEDEEEDEDVEEELESRPAQKTVKEPQKKPEKTEQKKKEPDISDLLGDFDLEEPEEEPELEEEPEEEPEPKKPHKQWKKTKNKDTGDESDDDIEFIDLE